MKRGNFLKMVATMIAAPTLMGDVEIKPVHSVEERSSFDGDRIKVYTQDWRKCRIGDLIVSDLGSMACIIAISSSSKETYIEARPIQKGEYKYKSLNDFRLMYRAVGERS